MKIQFYGAAQTVTGSQHLLEINGKRILLDCGFYQGKRQESYERNLQFPFDPTDLDAVILSHAHIDHSGNLPNLIKQGYDKEIFSTRATAHLANIMLMDSGHIQEYDVQYINKRRARRGEPPVEPIYTMEDAANVVTFFSPKRYQQEFEVVPGVIAHFEDAGHILGSAAVVLDIEEKNGASARKYRLWYSGDIGRRGLPLLRDPVLPSQVDYLIMECTYGDKPHNDPQEAYNELREMILRTLKRRGKIIIPAFAVGRTQDLVYNLHVMIEKGEIPNLPIFVDSPLAINVTDVYRTHPECFDDETQQFVQLDKHRKVLGFDHIIYTRSVEESKAINDRDEPMVIISASGMAETGRILHHLKNNIENPRNTILIVSWQAPHTLGRRLADRETEIKIFGEKYTRQAEVVTIGGFSAHAGQDMLVEYAQASQESLKGTYLIHGEHKAAYALQERLRQAGIRPVYFPELNSEVEI